MTWVCQIVHREGLDAETAARLKRSSKGTDTENYIWFVYEVVRLLTLSVGGALERREGDLEMTCWVALKVLVSADMEVT